MHNTPTQPLVSIIIPTRNSERTIKACLESIHNQSYSPVECIVVDNYSTDKTKTITQQYAVTFLEAGNERSAQRNAGAAHAKGKYICFIDSDMILNETVIEECVHMITQSHSLVALSIPEESFGTTFWAACKKFERSCYLNVDWMQGVRFFTRQSFKQLGGFNPDLVAGEDFDIHNRVEELFGTNSTTSINSLIYHNEGALQLTTILQKKYYYGKYIHKYFKEHHNKQKSGHQTNILKRLRLLFSRKDFMYHHPIIFLGTCIMKILEFVAGGIGYIAQYRL